MGDTGKLQHFPIQSVLDTIPDAVILTSITGTIESMNPAAVKLSAILPGLIAGSNIHDADPMFNLVDELPRSVIMPERETILDTPDGYPFTNGKGKKRIVSIDREHLLDSNKSTVGHLWVIKDISGLIRLRNDLQKKQALESIGFLAAGVAHDFNNLLAGIFGFIDLASQSIDDPAECAEHLDNARDVMRRACDLTAQLLTLSKGGLVQKKVTSIAKLLQDSVALSTMGTPVKRDVFIQNDLWNCNVDKGQISQVFNNILINAVQAMPSGGTIAVSALNSELEGKKVASLPEGKFVIITIRDTGCGISNETIDHIYDPYFTTKEKGSGLGLSVAWSVIKRHKGHIEVESVPGQGTVFTLYLPATIASADIDSTDVLYENNRPAFLRVLLMDDDTTLRNVLEKMLRKLKCEVTVAVSGEHALQTLREARGRNGSYDAAVLDLTIPGGKGAREIVTDVKILFPDIKTIVMSGYICDPVFEDPGSFGFHYCLKKPFLIGELSVLLNDIAAVKSGRHSK